MLVICEVCDNNVIDELSARKGETVCKLCKLEARKKLEKVKRNTKEFKAYQRKYRNEHREHLNAKARERYAKNKVKQNENSYTTLLYI